VIVATEGGFDAAHRILNDRNVVAKADLYGQYAELELTDTADPQDLLHRLVNAGTRLTRFEIAEPTLNKIFIDLVGPEAATAPAEEEAVYA